MLNKILGFAFYIKVKKLLKTLLVVYTSKSISIRKENLAEIFM